MRARGNHGRWRRGIGLAGGMVALSAAVLVVPTPTPVAALTSPLGMTTVGHSDLGTVLTSTTDFNYPGRLDLVNDSGTLLFSRNLADDPALQGVSRNRWLSFCADTVTSLNSVYDQDAGTTANSVIWYSLLGNHTATGTVALKANENLLTSAPGGWVTSTSDPDAGTTTLTYRGTNGSARSLGTIDQMGAGESVCDSSVSLVRFPFDGSGPVVLPQRPRSRPMSSFMISLEPAQILVTRASRQARATRYSFMKP